MATKKRISGGRGKSTGSKENKVQKLIALLRKNKKAKPVKKKKR
jgi:hypothetical protein